MKTLAERIKDLPKGTKLYSPCYGEVSFEDIENGGVILCVSYIGFAVRFHPNGSIDDYGECMLFPSKRNRDWDKFLARYNKFDVRTLQPFDKVLVRDRNNYPWRINFYDRNGSPKDNDFYCMGMYYRQCVPYNDDTKHLVGTTEQAPEYYITWEE